MKILVIGQSLEDHIVYGEKETVKPGGIFYSVLGLKSFIETGENILLLTSVERDNLMLFSPVYDDIEKSYFSYVDKIPQVFLNISEDNEREECYSLVNQNLTLESIKDYSDFDGILINMITGFDISLDQLKEIRSKYNRDIFFDVHTLSRGLDESGNRKFRTIPDFEKWASNIDIIQVNETEFSCLFANGEKGFTVQKLFAAGIKILIVTKGEIGARVYYKNKDEIVSSFVSSRKVETKNKVGCGDIFGAVFFYNYIKYHNIHKALILANAAGGYAASYDKIQNYEGLRKDVYERNS
jgi:sugar/nucleoside kinase (ribokinase family)